MTRRRGVVRTSAPRRRVRRVKTKWDPHITGRRFKIFMPQMSAELDFEIEVLLFLEEDVYPYLESQGIPGELWEYYIAFARRIWERRVHFNDATFLLEKASVVNEFTLRGLDPAHLMVIQNDAEKRAMMKLGRMVPNVLTVIMDGAYDDDLYEDAIEPVIDSLGCPKLRSKNPTVEECFWADVVIMDGYSSLPYGDGVDGFLHNGKRQGIIYTATGVHRIQTAYGTGWYGIPDLTHPCSCAHPICTSIPCSHVCNDFSEPPYTFSVVDPGNNRYGSFYDGNLPGRLRPEYYEIKRLLDTWTDDPYLWRWFDQLGSTLDTDGNRLLALYFGNVSHSYLEAKDDWDELNDLGKELHERALLWCGFSI